MFRELVPGLLIVALDVPEPPFEVRISLFVRLFFASLEQRVEDNCIIRSGDGRAEDVAAADQMLVEELQAFFRGQIGQFHDSSYCISRSV